MKKAQEKIREKKGWGFSHSCASPSRKEGEMKREILRKVPGSFQCYVGWDDEEKCYFSIVEEEGLDDEGNLRWGIARPVNEDGSDREDTIAVAEWLTWDEVMEWVES